MPAPAFAHGGEASIVLLLPTGYYILGAVAAVAATVLLTALLPERLATGLFRPALRLPAIPAPPAGWTSLAAFLMLALLVTAGFLGSRDPLLNPLPAFVWTAWWVCFTVALGLFGPLWRAVEPWGGVFVLARALSGRQLGRVPILALSPRLGHGVALLQFYAFAWFELVDIAPSDPQRLAAAVSLYWLVNALGMLVCGEADWKARAEPFSILFGLIGRAAPLAWRWDGQGRLRLVLVWPGRQLLDLPPLPASGVLFVLLTLATVSFDGLSRTFTWLSAVGVNPLEFEGRSTVMLSSSLGILAAFAALSLAYYASIGLGCLAAGETRFAAVAGRLVYSILPISLAFQFAHYLTMALVELQNLAVALSDPFARGWDLFGTADHRVTTSFLNGLETVERIFDAQAAAIVAGHVLAVILAHAVFATLLQRGAALRAELPFAALMVAYTGFGLWLLSTPRI